MREGTVPQILPPSLQNTEGCVRPEPKLYLWPNRVHWNTLLNSTPTPTNAYDGHNCYDRRLVESASAVPIFLFVQQYFSPIFCMELLSLSQILLILHLRTRNSTIRFVKHCHLNFLVIFPKEEKQPTAKLDINFTFSRINCKKGLEEDC
jgi:hypothetical protein